ncbi:MAG: hypothetical protein SFW66_09850 [Gammaproteobacteria bacterium]|nr:hypothetical protein [Gammaproteobacteria bacterium]
MTIKLNQFFYGYLENLILSIMIKQIKDKYDFKVNFDFYGWLRDLKNWSDLYNEHEDRLTVIREMKAHFTNLINVTTALTDLVANFSKQRDDFSKYLDPFADEALYYSPKLGLTHEEFQDILMDFKANWQKSLKSLPPIGKGRPSETHNESCVNLLVKMFMDGSKLKPRCYRNEHDGQYYGCFYDFMIDMQIILQSQGMTLDIKNESLGTYASKLIPKRRKDNAYSNTISQIDECLFQE